MTITSSSEIRTSFSTFNSSISSSMTVHRGVTYVLCTNANSSLITAFNFSFFDRISLYSLIRVSKWLASFSSSVISVFVKRYNCKLTIASACLSLNSNSLIKLIFAWDLLLLPRIILITSSKIEIALIKPLTICSRSLSFLSNVCVLLVTTSRRNLR